MSQVLAQMLWAWELLPHLMLAEQNTLNGAKMWITNGTIDGTDTETYFVYAKTGKGRGKDDLTSFLVEKGMPILSRPEN